MYTTLCFPVSFILSQHTELHKLLTCSEDRSVYTLAYCSLPLVTSILDTVKKKLTLLIKLTFQDLREDKERWAGNDPATYLNTQGKGIG